MHEDIDSFDSQHLCASACTLEFGERRVGLCYGLDGTLEPDTLSGPGVLNLDMYTHSMKTIIIENICNEFPDM